METSPEVNSWRKEIQLQSAWLQSNYEEQYHNQQKVNSIWKEIWLLLVWLQSNHEQSNSNLTTQFMQTRSTTATCVPTKQSIHVGRKYQCKQCNSQCTRKDSLITHHPSAHIEKKYPCKCNLCSYQTTLKSYLKKHKHTWRETKWHTELQGTFGALFCYRTYSRVVWYSKKIMNLI